MNYSALKILSDNDYDFHETRNKFIKTDAFTVLPPFSPQIPGPPPTPNPYRILPPIVSRKKPSFVILQEVGSRSTSREPSPSGRVSPFRGCGFKPSSPEHSPSRQPREEKSCDPTHRPRRSRSRLPVTQHQKIARRMSKSVSPVGHSNIPRPLNRHISYSPNRLTKILSEINSNHSKNTTSNQQKIETSKCSNLYRSSTSQRDPKKSGTSRVSALSLHVQKPQIPQSPLKTLTHNVQTNLSSAPPTWHEAQIGQTSKDERIKKSAGKKVTRQIPMSPVRAAKYEPTMKTNDNLTVVEKRTPMSPTRTRTVPPSRSPFKSFLAKSKENISPSSKSPSPVKTRTANTIRKSTTGVLRTPSETTAKAAKKPSCTKTPDTSVQDPKLDEIISPIVARTNETTALVVTQPSEERTEAQCDSKFNAVRTIGKKAFTTSNLLNAIKKKNMAEDKAEEKRELSHTDTSRSLPISIGGTGMTESAVTLIRTTTEPALAPIQPELITEIRSAINVVRNGIEETQLSKSESSSLSNPTLPNEMETSRDISVTEEEFEKKRTSPAAERRPFPPPQFSPHIKNVTAIGEIKMPSPGNGNDEDTSTKEKKEQTGTDKSFGVNNQTTTATVEAMKNENETLNIKKKSAECSVQQYANTMAWERFRSQRSKGGRSTDSHLVRVSTITQTPTTAQATEYSKESRYRKYFCYPCKKCKLRKHNGTINIVNSNSRNKRFYTRHKEGFQSLLNKLRCKDEQNSTTPTDAKTDSTSGSVQNRGFCPLCDSGVHKCMSILCCWNSTVCLKAQNRDDKLLCSSCKCLCCGTKKQTVITESERRRSTISTTRKPRKWIRVLTDFPKLDSSFVEHASVMRGAIPVLPLPLAWICLILNVFLPGFGTLSSGFFCLCTGKARFSINDSLASRFGSFLVNLLVAGSQLFTVLFCLVGWGWSIWWGVIMLRMARKNKRIMLAERVTNEPHPTSVVNQNRDIERGATN